jgi:hypothetical protein
LNLFIVLIDLFLFGVSLGISFGWMEEIHEESSFRLPAVDREPGSARVGGIVTQR